MMRVAVKPELLVWACKRAGQSLEAMARQPSFRKLTDWISGDLRPTLKQLEKFAQATYTPLGFFFLQKPPVQAVPIPDFRTADNQYLGSPSPGLLETIYISQQRQDPRSAIEAILLSKYIEKPR